MHSDSQANEEKNTTATTGTSSYCKKKKFLWTEDLEVALLKELVVYNPFMYRHGSTERGKVWERIAAALSVNGNGTTFVQRTVRDKYRSLATRHRVNGNKERAASGISPEETDIEKEIRELVEQLLELELDGESITPNNKKEEEKKKIEGVEMQKVMLERFSETQKRQNQDEDAVCKRKRRNNGTEAFTILEKKMEMDREFRRDEAVRRRNEEERRLREEKEKDRRFELLQQQHLQHQQQMQQQQQQMQQQLMQQQQFMQQQATQMQTMMLAAMKAKENTD